MAITATDALAEAEELIRQVRPHESAIADALARQNAVLLKLVEFAQAFLPVPVPITVEVPPSRWLDSTPP